MPSGGKREGAGRPRTTAVVRDDAITTRRLKTNAEKGWEVLADNYPKLMRAAIKMALGEDDLNPDKSMLKTLVELMPRIVGTEADQADSKITKLVESFLDRLPKARDSDDAPALEEYGHGREESADSTDTVRAGSNTRLS